MKKIIMATLLTLACTLSSSAEIRLLNYTGEDLKVDILHSSGQSRDIAISKDVALSPAIGPVNPRRTSEVMVVKDTSGKELGRFDVYSQSVTVFSRRGDGFFASNVGFFKGPTEHGYVKILNATGQEIHYSYETPSFILRQGKIEYDKPALRDWVMVLDGDCKPDQDIKVKLGINEPASGDGQILKGGGVYFASLVDGKLKLTKIAVD